MKFPSFEELAEVVRASARLKRNQRIDPDTQLSRDLKVNGKRGTDLLIAIERRYGILFSAKIHNQMQHVGSIQRGYADEFPVMQSLFASSKPEDNPATVGGIYKAVLEEMSRLPPLKPVSHQ